MSTRGSPINNVSPQMGTRVNDTLSNTSLNYERVMSDEVPVAPTSTPGKWNHWPIAAISAATLVLGVVVFLVLQRLRKTERHAALLKQRTDQMIGDNEMDQAVQVHLQHQMPDVIAKCRTDLHPVYGAPMEDITDRQITVEQKLVLMEQNLTNMGHHLKNMQKYYDDQLSAQAQVVAHLKNIIAEHAWHLQRQGPISSSHTPQSQNHGLQPNPVSRNTERNINTLNAETGPTEHFIKHNTTSNKIGVSEEIETDQQHHNLPVTTGKLSRSASVGSITLEKENESTMGIINDVCDPDDDNGICPIEPATK